MKMVTMKVMEKCLFQWNSGSHRNGHTAQKMKFSIKDLFSKCAQIGRKLRILSNLLKKSLMDEAIARML